MKNTNLTKVSRKEFFKVIKHYGVRKNSKAYMSGRDFYFIFKQRKSVAGVSSYCPWKPPLYLIREDLLMEYERCLDVFYKACLLNSCGDMSLSQVLTVISSVGHKRRKTFRKIQLAY